MRLILTTSCPWKSNYCAENGEVVYIVTSPFKLIGKKTKIEKAAGRGGRYSTIATIDFNVLLSSVITFDGRALKTKSLFRTTRWSGNQVFTGPDGREYKWKIGSTKPELYLNGSEHLVAKYHRPHGGFLSRKRPASLEIFSPGDRIADFIVATFIYIEKTRKDGEIEPEDPDRGDDGGGDGDGGGGGGDGGGGGGGDGGGGGGGDGGGGGGGS